MSFGLSAQTQTASLSFNNTSIQVMNGGDFFWDLSTSRYEIPKKSGSSSPVGTIFSGSVWMGGVDISGNLRLAAMTYRQRGQDFKPGPLSFDTASKSSDHDKIYTVSKTQIDAHIANPSSTTGVILEWPGNGDTSKGEPYQLAPFVDLNSNGKYEPKLGDYPKIKGIGATYCIYNDYVLHTESGGEPIQIEIHQMFYQDAFTHNGVLIDDVNLASFTIINRGFQRLSNFVFGVFTDFDLGNFSDDYVGTDSTKNMVYAYNGDDNDEGILGYGLNPPAQNMMFLNHNLGSAMYYNNNANPVNGNPTKATDYYNYLNARYKNGDPLIHPGGTKTKFMFSGDPVTGTGWTEQSVSNTPGDRRILASSEPMTLEPNMPICFDIAYVYGRATSGGSTASISTMRDKADIVQTVYDNNTYGWKSGDCILGAQDEDETVGILPNLQKSQFSVYPNPSTGLFHIKDLKSDMPSYVTDATGKVLMIIEPQTTTFDIHNLATGLYFLKTELGTVRLLKL